MTANPSLSSSCALIVDTSAPSAKPLLHRTRPGTAGVCDDGTGGPRRCSARAAGPVRVDECAYSDCPVLVGGSLGSDYEDMHADAPGVTASAQVESRIGLGEQPAGADVCGCEPR